MNSSLPIFSLISFLPTWLGTVATVGSFFVSFFCAGIIGSFFRLSLMSNFSQRNKLFPGIDHSIGVCALGAFAAFRSLVAIKFGFGSWNELEILLYGGVFTCLVYFQFARIEVESRDSFQQLKKNILGSLFLTFLFVSLSWNYLFTFVPVSSDPANLSQLFELYRKMGHLPLSISDSNGTLPGYPNGLFFVTLPLAHFGISSVQIIQTWPFLSISLFILTVIDLSTFRYSFKSNYGYIGACIFGLLIGSVVLPSGLFHGAYFLEGLTKRTLYFLAGLILASGWFIKHQNIEENKSFRLNFWLVVGFFSSAMMFSFNQINTYLSFLGIVFVSTIWFSFGASLFKWSQFFVSALTAFALFLPFLIQETRVFSHSTVVDFFCNNLFTTLDKCRESLGLDWQMSLVPNGLTEQKTLSDILPNPIENPLLLIFPYQTGPLGSQLSAWQLIGSWFSVGLFLVFTRDRWDVIGRTLKSYALFFTMFVILVYLSMLGQTLLFYSFLPKEVIHLLKGYSYLSYLNVWIPVFVFVSFQLYFTMFFRIMTMYSQSGFRGFKKSQKALIVIVLAFLVAQIVETIGLQRTRKKINWNSATWVHSKEFSSAVKSLSVAIPTGAKVAVPIEKAFGGREKWVFADYWSQSVVFPLNAELTTNFTPFWNFGLLGTDTHKSVEEFCSNTCVFLNSTKSDFFVGFTRVSRVCGAFSVEQFAISKSCLKLKFREDFPNLNSSLLVYSVSRI